MLLEILKNNLIFNNAFQLNFLIKIIITFIYNKKILLLYNFLSNYK